MSKEDINKYLKVLITKCQEEIDKTLADKTRIESHLLDSEKRYSYMCEKIAEDALIHKETIDVIFTDISEIEKPIDERIPKLANELEKPFKDFEDQLCSININNLKKMILDDRRDLETLNTVIKDSKGILLQLNNLYLALNPDKVQ